MCSRIIQRSGPLDYVERIFPNRRRVFDESSDTRYRVSPGTRPFSTYHPASDVKRIRQARGWRNSSGG